MCCLIRDVYIDYLISQNKRSTATGLSDLLDGELSHDQVTRFLNSEAPGAKELWLEVKADVREHEDDNGVLSLDDMVAEKPYMDESSIVNWYYSHGKGRAVKGINLVSLMVRYGDINLPVGYQVMEKDVCYSDIKTKKVKRKSELTKNNIFQSLLKQAMDNQVKFRYVLADNWFSSKEILNTYILIWRSHLFLGSNQIGQLL